MKWWADAGASQLAGVVAGIVVVMLGILIALIGR